MAADTTFIWGTGRRKTAIARVRIRPGNGTMQVNNSEAQLPGWLYPNYKQIFADALQQSPA